ncbi:MAG TPA: hypothetical protein VD861_11485 [Pyrinomonadaceae bacterium]|nr:hypothetical protein [Pyrinomonadaceae bacterium]
MGGWYSFDEGRSIGTKGSEGGTILRDEEHTDGSRITLERGGSRRLSITCGIYGWMVHTRFFSDEGAAQSSFEEMKNGLAKILDIIPAVDEADANKINEVSDKISDFIERFP